MWAASHRNPETAAGMESPDARKAWGGGRADMDPWPRQAHGSRRRRTSDARETGEAGAPMWTPGPRQAHANPAASKAWRGRRADVGNSGAVKLMKIAAAKAAVESAAGKTGGDGRGAGAETRRGANAASAKATQAWAAAGVCTPERRRRLGRRGGASVGGRRGSAPGDGQRPRQAMMAPDRGAAKGLRMKGPIQPKPSFHRRRTDNSRGRPAVRRTSNRRPGRFAPAINGRTRTRAPAAKAPTPALAPLR